MIRSLADSVYYYIVTSLQEIAYTSIQECLFLCLMFSSLFEFVCRLLRAVFYINRVQIYEFSCNSATISAIF